jgi:NADPH-dependent 2,4-dienoyl-CoA reductase/sulfur reductase-like enzyme
MLAALRWAGIPVYHGVNLVHAEGLDRVTRLVWRTGGREHGTPCDAIAFGHGLRSETQLADLAGCRFTFDTHEQAWMPQADAAGCTSVPGVYLAGDGAGILGADAAELSGARAALSALQDLGASVAPAHCGALEHGLQAQQRFRTALQVMSPLPPDWVRTVTDDLIVCRCEEVTAGDLRACAQATGAGELNRLKAFSRVGMGRCQGRMCGAAAARLLADAAGCELAAVGRLRGQPPIKPVPVGVLADALAAQRAVPPEERDD